MESGVIVDFEMGGTECRSNLSESGTAFAEKRTFRRIESSMGFWLSACVAIGRENRENGNGLVDL